MPEHGRMLLVEDNPDDVELMLAALAECGFAGRVDVARDGAAALDVLQAGAADAGLPAVPAVVVLDLKLPKRDGLDVLAVMRADPRLRFVPVVIVTSSRETSDLQRSYAAGANAYVVKPVRFTHFAAAMRDIGRFWLERNEPLPR